MIVDQAQLLRAEALIALHADAAKYRAEHSREFAPSWYSWQREGFDSYSPQIMTLAGNRCIGPSTQIETPDGLVPVEELISSEGFDVVSWDGESRCVRAASPVFLKGIEPMFRFRMDNGSFFDCTRNHRVLARYGWISAGQLMWLLSGLRWTEIVGDFQASCDAYANQCGQQLRLVSGSDLSSLPLPGDAQERFHPSQTDLTRHGVWSLKDAEGRGFLYNQISPDAYLLSIGDGPAWLSALCEKFANPEPLLDVQLLPEKHQDVSRCLFESAHLPQSTVEGVRGQDESLSASDILVAGNRVVSIQYIGFQPVLDTTVEETHNYFAAGVIHHNSGKTMSAGYHTACDLTCDYPEWWTGFRFEHGINCLAMGVDNQQLRDVVQQELFGDVIEEGNKRSFAGGWVHKGEIGRIEWSPYGSGLARRVEVVGKGGMANCTLRAYSQSRTGTKTLSFAGTSIDLIWVDECPPDELVGQLVVRTMTGNFNKGGRIRYTMTPELGATNLVTQFMEDREKSQQLIGPVSWDMCTHITKDVQESILAGIPEHEHDMRSKGTPFFGSGLVYPITEGRIKVEPFPIPEHWRCIRAMDLGVNHPTAICWLAYNADEDTIYLVRTYAVRGENAATHAAAANALWPHTKMVFPHDVDITEKGSGKTVRRFYADAGLKNSIDFKNPDGTISVEPGIFDLTERMRDGRFKAFSTCEEFFREYRLYHRDNGKIVKANDDVMDATRYGAIMVAGHGTPVAGLQQRSRRAITGLSVRMKGRGRGRR